MQYSQRSDQLFPWTTTFVDNIVYGQGCFWNEGSTPFFRHSSLDELVQSYFLKFLRYVNLHCCAQCICEDTLHCGLALEHTHLRCAKTL